MSNYSTGRSKKSVVLVGDGRMAQESLEILEAHSGIRVLAVVHHRPPYRHFRRLRPVDVNEPEKLIECQNINDPIVLSRVRELAPDLILSVNNHDIMKPSLLAIPVDGAINFHNGPLPAYRGVNIPSWAIINGETRHTVTWHFVIEGIDAGPIVRTKEFALSNSETAISLIFKCIDEGLRLLPGLLDDYSAGGLQPTPQKGEGRYYSADETPNNGRIDFSMDCHAIDRLVRGLTFHPFPNEFVVPYVETPAGHIHVGAATPHADSRRGPAGEVLRTENGTVVIRCNDGCVALEYLADEHGRDLDATRIISEFGLTPGMQL